MKKSCDLCLDLRPVVYCEADAARLCLSCDAKVHSANPIVDSHQRTLLCDSCKYRSADDQCLDHRMFMCRVCDQSLHRHSSRPHQKRTMISSYTGCPSAKEFAAFWGFKLNENLSTSTGRNAISSHGDGGKYQKSSSNSFILDQILDLKRLQLCEENNPNSLLVSAHDQQSHDKRSLVHHHNGTTSSRKFESNEELPFYTESFWHCRSPVQNSQLWSQNMQDLGVCEEQTYDHADLNTPDVDSIFRNFEESFGADQYVPYEGHARAKEKYDYKCRAAIHESYAANSKGR